MDKERIKSASGTIESTTINALKLIKGSRKETAIKLVGNIKPQGSTVYTKCKRLRIPEILPCLERSFLPPR